MVIEALKWLGVVLGGLVVLLVVGFTVVPKLGRRAMDRWGATDEEVREQLPGDELVREPQQNATRAITIDAPPELVMRLVRQQGFRRAGWHGWDWFYNATGSGAFVDGHFSTRIVPELQEVTPGDTIRINQMVGFTVERDELPEEESPGVFLLFSGADDADRPVRAAEAQRATKVADSWLWYARPLPDGGTRLILRIRQDMRGLGAFWAWFYDNPLEFGSALFAHKTLVGIKRTAEGLAPRD